MLMIPFSHIAADHQKVQIIFQLFCIIFLGRPESPISVCKTDACCLWIVTAFIV